MEAHVPECNWVAPKNDPMLADGAARRLRKSFETNHFANGGPCVRELESLLRTALRIDDDRAVVAVCNGSIAVQLAAQAIDLRDKTARKWCTQAYTFPPSVQGYLEGSAVVDTCCLGGPDIELVPKNVSGMIVTNVFGNVVDIEKYEAWREGTRRLVFDNAATPHSFYRGKNSLNYGDAATVSFHHTKPLGFGEGGAVVIRKEYEGALRSLMNFGFSNEGPDYFLSGGTNGKMSDVAAAYISERVGRLPELLDISASKEKLILSATRCDGYRLYPSYHDQDVPRLLPCVCLLSDDSEAVIGRLNRSGIGARRYYVPLVRGLAHAEEIFRRIVLIPCHEGLRAAHFSQLLHREADTS